MERYAQKMKFRHFDLDAGKLVAVLNEVNSKELGVLPMERVQVTNLRNKKSTAAVVDVTDSMVEENCVGLFNDIVQLLNLKPKDVVEVKAISAPDSLAYIKKKLDGEALNEKELQKIVSDLNSNILSDVEAAAFVSGVYIHGFNLDETTAMAKALANSGERLNLKKKPCVDKHSIGGTNGRVTMVLVPIMASLGCYIPKTSSRSITSAAGTADAMEVVANVSLNLKKIKEVTEKIGGCIVWGGGLELAPGDDKIIKIEHPLSLDPNGQIIASVMAKKFAVGAKYLVIDLPVGPGVKISTEERAHEMAKKFIEVGKRLGIQVEVVITDGTEPSGKAFGPALEAKYALQALEGKFFDNLSQKACELSGVLLELCGKSKKGKGFYDAKQALESGKALKKMKEIIKAQGAKALSSEEIKTAKFSRTIFAKEDGVIHLINVRKCTTIARLAGAPADHKAGILLHIETGQKVKKGQKLYEIQSENERKLKLAEKFANEDNVIELKKIILEKLD